MIKRYTTIDGILLNDANIVGLDKYLVEYVDPINDDIQKIEMHFSESDVVLEYFLKQDESVEAVFNLYKEKYSSILITKRSTLGVNTKHETWEFRDNQLLFRYNILFDANNEVLCEQTLDLITSQPDYEQTYKALTLNGQLLLEADNGDYDENGDLVRILYMPTENEQDWESYNGLNLSNLGTSLNLDLSYYLNATLDPA